MIENDSNITRQLSIATAELTRLKSACAKEHESVQKLDEENQRLKSELQTIQIAFNNATKELDRVTLTLKHANDTNKPLTDYLEQNYYVEQTEQMQRELCEMTNKLFSPCNNKLINALEQKLLDWASTYVHGANLTAVISSNRQLRAAIQAVLNHRHEDKDGNFVMWIGEGTFSQCEEALNQTTESAK